MKKLYFEDFEALAAEISDMFDTVYPNVNDDMLGSVCVIAKYEAAKQIIEQLVCIGYPIANVNIEMPEMDNYIDEFVIDLAEDGIWCERAKRDGKYIWCESDICYVLDDCSAKIIPYLKGYVNNFEVGIGDRVDCSDDYQHSSDCRVCKKAPTDTNKVNKTNDTTPINTEKYDCKLDEDGDMHGITVSKSDGVGRYGTYSIYSTKEYPIETLRRFLPEWFN